MADQEFYPILTKTGKEKEMACLDGQTEFDIWEIAVGDGNGALYEPDENQTSLKNECWRGLVAKCENEDDTRYAIVHIPADIGGFTIREIGAFDKSGNLLIVAKCAETVKRLPETGDIKQLSIRLDLSVINELVLPFLIDPSINTATVEYCDKHYQNLNQKAQPEGYAPLDETALLPDTHLPDVKHQLVTPFPQKAYGQADYPKEYAHIVNQAHSTFDLVKFEVVGRPTISADGILSDISTQKNYVKIQLPDNTVLFTFRLKPPYSGGLLGDESPDKAIKLRLQNGIFRLYLSSNGSDWNIANELYSAKTQISDDWNYLYIKLEQTDEQYLLSYSQDALTYTTAITVDSALPLYAGPVVFGCETVTDKIYNNYQGSIDLKSFAAWGNKTINGCKTSIDTIKAPDYTVVGSPTISDSGIASGFSNVNYITKTLNSNFLNEDFDIVIPVGITTPGSDTGNSLFLYDNNSHLVARSFCDSSGYLFSLSCADNSVLWNGANAIPTNNLKADAINYMRITRIGNEISLYGWFNNQWRFRTKQNVAEGKTFSQITNMYIGAQRKGENPLSSYTDLNEYKFYSNGSLIYQPCLYIPYTESTSGIKIVDAAYLNRVQDCYAQTGKALYVVVDRQKQAIYQPQGSIAGFLSQNASNISQNTKDIKVNKDNIEQINSNIAEINQDILSISSDISDLDNTKAEKTAVVNISGNQTIKDTKTFEEPIIGDLQGNSDSATVTKYSGDAVFPAQGSVEVPGELPVGLSFSRGYNSPENSPGPYGHLINLRSTGSANTQLFLSWNASNDTAAIYYRSHRESGEGAWTPWKTRAFTDSTVAKAVSDANGANIADTYLKKDMENLAEAIKSTIYATGSSTNLKIPVDGTNNQVIIKSGGITSPAYITFPEAFPTACSNVVVTCHTTESCVSAAISDITRSGFNVRSGTHGGIHEDRTLWVSWIAIGY